MFLLVKIHHLTSPHIPSKGKKSLTNRNLLYLSKHLYQGHFFLSQFNRTVIKSFRGYYVIIKCTQEYMIKISWISLET